MRDFRDAKAIAQTLRETLADKAVSITHSESLEIVSKLFGLDNWNILSAKITAEPSAVSDKPRSETNQPEADQLKKTLYCSFCGKSQHEVKKLIAGPAVFICEECVALCDDIIEEEHSIAVVPSGSGQDRKSIEDSMRIRSSEDLVAHKARIARIVERARKSLAQLETVRTERANGRPPEPLPADIRGRDALSFLRTRSLAELDNQIAQTRNQLDRAALRLDVAAVELRARGI